MAANIDMSNNRANIAYRGDVPWHSLGTAINPGDTIEVIQAKAGLDFRCEKAKEAHEFKGRYITTEDFILRRDDTGAKLGNCTGRYHIVQPFEVMEFYRDLVEKYGFELETAGSLDGGKKVWALAKTGDQFRIMGQDQISTYLMLATSFDGSMGTICKPVHTRVVCWNTLSAALREYGQMTVKVPHNTKFDANKVKLELGLYSDATQQIEKDFNKLANVSVNRAQAMKFIINVLTGQPMDERYAVEHLSTRAMNQIQTVYNLFDGQAKGAEFRSSKGTAFGLVNAVTEFVDWQAGNNDNNRFRSAHFGEGEKRKRFAFEEALKMAA